MALDLHDMWGWLQRLIRRVERLESGAFLENSSITGGRLRFIGGLLRLDSGALLELIGQWRFFGNGAISGDVVAEGKWTQNGPWEFNGPGDIDGDVLLGGDFNLTGKLTAAGIRIEDGIIWVGTSGSLIAIDGTTGQIVAGSMVIDPTGGGSVTFPGGAVVKAGSSGGVAMTQGSYTAVITATGASIGKTGLNVSVTDAVGVQFVGLPTTTGKGVPAGTLWADTTNRVFRALS